MTDTATFDPGRYLTKVNGADYLEVKWRLVWLRSVHPDAAIETEMIPHESSQALFRAKVTLPSGASSTGWGSEAPDNFGNYIEKAETKAIGRALAALGFGTQFCPDFDFGADQGHVVDAPVRVGGQRGSGQSFVQIDQAATARQQGLIQALVRQARLSEDDLDELTQSLTGKGYSELGRRDASRVIEHLKERQAGGGNQLAS